MDSGLAPLTSLSDGTPTGDPGLTAWWELKSWGGQTNGPDVLVKGDVGIQLHKGNVVVVAAGIILWVGEDPPHLPAHRPLIGLTLY